MVYVCCIILCVICCCMVYVFCMYLCVILYVSCCVMLYVLPVCVYCCMYCMYVFVVYNKLCPCVLFYPVRVCFVLYFYIPNLPFYNPFPPFFVQPFSVITHLSTSCNQFVAASILCNPIYCLPRLYCVAKYTPGAQIGAVLAAT